MVPLVLFVHISGVLAMFAGLALEAFGTDAVRKAAPRLSGIAMALTVVSGLYLGSLYGVLRGDWLRATYGAILIMTAAGALARRSATLQRFSLWVRTAFGLAVVYLMVAKPDAVGSLVVLGLALGASTLLGLATGQRQRVGLSRV